MNNNKGFSIPELMMVVTILGILAAIAIPTYNHQINKSHQNEAKANLSALDSAMKAFWSEYATAAGTLDVIGFKPSGMQYYGLGFSNNQLPPPNALGYLPGDTGCYYTAGAAQAMPTTCSPAGFTSWTNNLTAESYTTFGTAGSTANTASFVAGAPWHAYARAILNAGGTDDEWTIDSHDTLTNTLNGM